MEIFVAVEGKFVENRSGIEIVQGWAQEAVTRWNIIEVFIYVLHYYFGSCINDFWS